MLSFTGMALLLGSMQHQLWNWEIVLSRRFNVLIPLTAWLEPL